MSARRGARYLALAGLACVLCLQSALASCALGSSALPWLLASASGRRALQRRWHGLVLLLGSGVVGGLVFAAVSGEPLYDVLVRFVAPIAARVYGALIFLCLATHDLTASELEATLYALHLPEGFVELVVATQRFGRQLEATLRAAWAACVLRGGLSSPRALAQTVGAVAGIVLLRSIDRSERVAVAQALRAGRTADDP
jgi:hypothetical protein